ncbi:hypothetical protein NQZ68_015149 [Dissostichus eleginoides]|nr:hypothetical protein NQZ68_015149 [Dissostichus eleginoides]
MSGQAGIDSLREWQSPAAPPVHDGKDITLSLNVPVLTTESLGPMGSHLPYLGPNTAWEM